MTTPAALSSEDIHALPAVLDVPTAGRLLGLGRAASYALARRDELPVPVIHLGRQLRVPTQPLLQVLGLRSEQPEEVSGAAVAGSADLRLLHPAVLLAVEQTNV